MVAVVQSETGIDWVQLRRQIEDFATRRKRPPTPLELKHFLADHGVGPSMVDSFLTQMSSPARHSRATPPTSDAGSQRPDPVVSVERSLAPAVIGVGQHDGLPQPADWPDDEVRSPSSPRVADAVEDLVDDWHRQGGALQRDQVVSLAAKRKLSATELAEVDQQLRHLGIETGHGPAPIQTTERSPERVKQGHEDVLGAYLHEIGRHRLIYAEDEVRLGRAIHAGLRATRALAEAEKLTVGDVERLGVASAEGRHAHARLVEANLRLVVSIARQARYAFSNTELIDRIQMGNEGLLHAADRFDPELGFKFSTYATWWIKQRIDRSIADTGRAIRLPVHVHEKLNKIRRARRRLDERLDREPTPVELAEATGYTPGEVQAILDYLTPVRSLEEPIGPDAVLLDLLADQTDDVDGRGDPQDHFLAAARRQDLDAVLEGLLAAREYDILVRRYGLDDGEIQTFDAIGRAWNITRERVRQLEKKTLTLLRNSGDIDTLYDYLLDDTKLDRPRPPAGTSDERTGPADGSETSPRAADVSATIPRTGGDR